MIAVKTPAEISSMRTGGKKLGRILHELLVQSQPGVSLLEIEEHAKKRILEEGGLPSFTTVEGYPYVTCLCINEQVVHGMPSAYILQEGDVLTIDIGMIYEGLHTDTAWTKIVSSLPIEQQKPETRRFLEVGEEALQKAVQATKAGGRVGDISKAIQTTIEAHGYSVVKDLTGHGVGKNLHEEPMIPGFIRGEIERTPQLTAGMTIAIEVIYAEGKGSIVYSNADGWTLETRDRSLTACFEYTVSIELEKTTVLTNSSV